MSHNLQIWDVTQWPPQRGWKNITIPWSPDDDEDDEEDEGEGEDDIITI